MIFVQTGFSVITILNWSLMYILIQDADSVATAAAVVVAVNPLVATAAVLMASQQKAVAAAVAAANKNKELLDKSVIVSTSGMLFLVLYGFGFSVAVESISTIKGCGQDFQHLCLRELGYDICNLFICLVIVEKKLKQNYLPTCPQITSFQKLLYFSNCSEVLRYLGYFCRKI